MVEKVIAIVPAYNEERHIRLVIQSLQESVKAGVISDFIIVANGCKDLTYRKAVTWGAKTINLPIANKGNAFIEGVKWANKQGASTIVTIDADAEKFAPSAIEHLARPVLLKRTPMSISGFVYKNSVSYPEYVSGFRAISMNALKPILAGNRDWINSFTPGKYSLEVGLNAKIFGAKYAKFSSMDAIDVLFEGSIKRHSKLLQESIQPVLFKVRRAVRDASVVDDVKSTCKFVKERQERLVQKLAQRKIPFALRRLKIK